MSNLKGNSGNDGLLRQDSCATLDASYYKGVGQGTATRGSWCLRTMAGMARLFQLTFCDANGTRKDRRNGGLYITENPPSAPTLGVSAPRETLVFGGNG